MITQGFFAQFLIKKGFEVGLQGAGKVLTNLGAKLFTTADDVLSALEKHLSVVRTWTEEIAFADLASAKLTHKVYVQLDCFVIQRRLRMHDGDSIGRIRLESLFNQSSQHLLFLGTPGAGKTTSMKHICHRLITDDTFAQGRNMFPILIRLRNLERADGKNPLLMELAATLGLKYFFSAELEGRSMEAQRVRTIALVESICAFLNETEALIILDGLDEISDFDARRAVADEIRELALRLVKPTLVTTSRTGEVLLSMDNVKVFEICPLTNNQISKFAQKWLGSKARAKKFLDQVKASPFHDSAMKPLNLAHLCALFERSGSIPEKPRTVYKKILSLLLNDWDEQRSVTRKSRYAKFESDRKYDFLSTVAYHLTAERQRLTFNSQVIVSIYKEIYRDFGLPEEEAKAVAKEVESHTGLLLQCGFDEFEFAHKSLHEFLAAEFVVRLPTIPNDVATLRRLPNELAIAVSISSNASLYFLELVFAILGPVSGQLSEQFFTAFVARLIQERPDFNGQPAVVLALLTLYSMTIECFSGSGKQPSLFLYDPLLSEFETLVRLVTSTNRVLELDEHYLFLRQTGTWGDQIILQYKRSKLLEGYTIPEYLFVRQSFVLQISNKDVSQQQFNV